MYDKSNAKPKLAIAIYTPTIESNIILNVRMYYKENKNEPTKQHKLNENIATKT